MIKSPLSEKEVYKLFDVIKTRKDYYLRYTLHNNIYQSIINGNIYGVYLKNFKRRISSLKRYKREINYESLNESIIGDIFKSLLGHGCYLQKKYSPQKEEIIDKIERIIYSKDCSRCDQ